MADWDNSLALCGTLPQSIRLSSSSSAQLCSAVRLVVAIGYKFVASIAGGCWSNYTGVPRPSSCATLARNTHCSMKPACASLRHLSFCWLCAQARATVERAGRTRSDGSQCLMWTRTATHPHSRTSRACRAATLHPRASSRSRPAASA